jgi:hypothetical protein
VLRVEHNLCVAFPVAQLDKDDPAEIAPGMYPTG